MPGDLYLDTGTGKVMQTADAERAQQRGWKPISQPEADAIVADRKAKAEAGSATGVIRTGLEGFSTGAFDALTAAAKVPVAASMAMQEGAVGVAQKLGLAAQGTKEELARNNTTLLAQTSGRQMLANTFGVIDELVGNQNAEAGALQNAQQQRLDAEVNRGTAFTGTAAGQILAAAPFVGLTGGAAAGLGKSMGGSFAARQAGRFLVGAVEGAPIAAIASQDAAFLEDRQLSAQQMMADTGLGSFLAGSVSFAGGLVSEGVGAAKRSISAKLAARGAAASPEAAAALEAGAAELAPEAAGPTGKMIAPPANYSKAQMMRDLAVADDAGIINVAGNELGAAVSPELPKVLRQVAREGTTAAREEMVAESVTKLAAPMRELLPAQEAIQEIVDSAPLKGTQMAAKFARDGIGDEAIAKAREYAGRLASEVRAIGDTSEVGGKQLFGLVRQIDRYEDIVRSASTPEAAHLAVDQMRRDLLTGAKAFGRSAGAPNADTFAREELAKLTTTLHQKYMGAVGFLSDQGTWGSVGAAQEAVNNARQKLIQATEDGIGTITTQLESKNLDLATGRYLTRREVDQGKLESMVQNFGTNKGARSEVLFRRYQESLGQFAEAVGKHYELDGAQAAALQTLRSGAKAITSTFDEVSTNAAAHNQVAALLERHGGGSIIDAKLGGVVGGFVGGAPGAALGAAAGAGVHAMSNPVETLMRRVKLEGAAQSGRARAGALLDSFFTPIRKAASATGEVIADQAPKMAARLEFQSPRAAFQGQHETAQDAYLARVNEIQDAGRNFAQGARDGAHKSFGELVTTDPHVTTAAVVTATNAINFLQSKIPVDPLFDPESMTPTASKLRPSPAQLGEFARYWHAVYEPMSVLKSLKNGTAGPQEIEALQAVYPSFYQWVRTETMARLQKLDADGITVPPYQRQLLDALLDLKGAGDRTLSADFAIKYGDRMGDSSRPQNPPARPAPSSRPLRSSLHTETDSMLGGAQ